MQEDQSGMAQDEKPKRVEQTLILPREPDPVAAGEPPPDADDDFRVLALDTFEPQPIALGPACQDLRGFAVFITHAAVTNIMRHGAKGLETNHEVAGGLVGRPCIEPQTGLLFTQISAAWAVQGHADQF